MKKRPLCLGISLMALALISGCSSASANKPDTQPTTIAAQEDATLPTHSNYTDSSTLESSAVSMEGNHLQEVLTPAQSILLIPEASGIHVTTNDYAMIDYSHTEDGYVMVQFTAQTTQKLKTQVIGPTTTYTYNLSPNEWTTFPLSDGNGTYTIKVYENIVDKRYALVLAAETPVTLADEFAPFIRPNQYVNYQDAIFTMETAARLTQGIDDLLTKVSAIYNYVVTNISYDYEKAATVESGYLPDLDAVLTAKKGICFDYASLMTGMLRSQGIPCKLVVGYAGDVYHAWINVWSQTTGWIDGAVYFDGISWQRLDPTYAASVKNPQSAADFIGNGNNYTSKYIY